jgi:hypothetical protein
MPVKSSKTDSSKGETKKRRTRKSSLKSDTKKKSTTKKRSTCKCGGLDKNVNSQNNNTPKKGQKVYIVPYRKENRSFFVNSDLYTVNSVNGNNYTISKKVPGTFYGLKKIEKKLKKSKISPPVGYQYNNNKIEIGKEYIVETINGNGKLFVKRTKPVQRLNNKTYRTITEHFSKGKRVFGTLPFKANKILENERKREEREKQMLNMTRLLNNNIKNGKSKNSKSNNSKFYNPNMLFPGIHSTEFD